MSGEVERSNGNNNYNNSLTLRLVRPCRAAKLLIQKRSDPFNIFSLRRMHLSQASRRCELHGLGYGKRRTPPHQTPTIRLDSSRYSSRSTPDNPAPATEVALVAPTPRTQVGSARSAPTSHPPADTAASARDLVKRRSNRATYIITYLSLGRWLGTRPYCDGRSSQDTYLVAQWNVRAPRQHRVTGVAASLTFPHSPRV